MSKMRNTRLPPTWAVVNATISDKKTSRLSCISNNALAESGDESSSSINNTPENTELEYVNCVTGERTPQHPGMSYFLAEVESERSNNKRPGEVTILSAPSTETISGGSSNNNHNNNSPNCSGSNSIGGGVDSCGGTHSSVLSPTVRHPQPENNHAGEGSGNSTGIATAKDTTMNSGGVTSNSTRYYYYYCCIFFGEWREIACRMNIDMNTAALSAACCT